MGHAPSFTLAAVLAAGSIRIPDTRAASGRLWLAEVETWAPGETLEPGARR